MSNIVVAWALGLTCLSACHFGCRLVITCSVVQPDAAGTARNPWACEAY